MREIDTESSLLRIVHRVHVSVIHNFSDTYTTHSNTPDAHTTTFHIVTMSCCFSTCSLYLRRPRFAEPLLAPAPGESSSSLITSASAGTGRFLDATLVRSASTAF